MGWLTAVGRVCQNKGMTTLMSQNYVDATQNLIDTKDKSRGSQEVLIAAANAQAILALVREQRIANLLAYCANAVDPEDTTSRTHQRKIKSLWKEIDALLGA